MGVAPADASRYQVLGKSGRWLLPPSRQSREQQQRSDFERAGSCHYDLVVVVAGGVKPRICCGAASVFMVCESQQRVKGRAGDADRAGLYFRECIGTHFADAQRRSSSGGSCLRSSITVVMSLWTRSRRPPRPPRPRPPPRQHHHWCVNRRRHWPGRDRSPLHPGGSAGSPGPGVPRCCNYITTGLAEAAATDPIISSETIRFIVSSGRMSSLSQNKKSGPGRRAASLTSPGSDVRAHAHARLRNGFRQAEEFMAKPSASFFMVCLKHVNDPPGLFSPFW